MSLPHKRARLLTIASLCIVIFFAIIISYRGAVRTQDVLLPVSVTVESTDSNWARGVRLGAVHLSGEEIAARNSPSGRWIVPGPLLRALRFHLPRDWEQRLKGVSVSIGERRYDFDADGLKQRWQQAAPASRRPASDDMIVLASPTKMRGSSSQFGSMAEALNWPGDLTFLGHVLWWPFSLLVAICMAMLALPRLLQFAPPGPGVGWLGVDSREAAVPSRPEGAVLWIVFGLAVLLLAGALIELRDPYYFAQDDNLSQFLPTILHGCALLGAGYWPDYNPYQFLGTPMASVGTYGLSYPPLWISCLVSDRILGQPTAVLEAFALLHLAAGFLATFWLGRSQGLGPALATACGLSFVLCGYFLIAGRSWFYMLPVAAWLPLLMLSATRLGATERPLRWSLLTGLFIGAFFHAGNAQMWFYALMFWSLALLLQWLGRALAWRRVLWAGAAVLFGIGIAAPLLLPQSALVSGIFRRGGEGNGIFEGIPALLLPYPLVTAGHPNGWGNAFIERMGQLYYSGTVLTVAGFAAIAFVIAFGLRNRLDRALVARGLWPLLAVLAFLLALGPAGGLWDTLVHLPIFRLFDHPFKYLPYLVLFTNLAGAIALQGWLGRRQAWLGATTVLVVGLMLLHASLARSSFYSYGDEPYPALPSAMQELLALPDGQLPPRVVRLAPYRWPEPGYSHSLMHNLATYYAIPAFDGYDNLIAFGSAYRDTFRRLQEEPLNTSRAFAVRWLVRFTGREPTGTVRRLQTDLEHYYSPGAEALMSKLQNREPALALDDLEVYDLRSADPIAFIRGQPAQPLAVRTEGNRVIVSLPERKESATVVMAFLHRPGLRLSGDGVPLEAATDSWGRITAEVAPTIRQLGLEYDAGWHRGLVLGLILIVAGGAVAALARWTTGAPGISRRPD